MQNPFINNRFILFGYSITMLVIAIANYFLLTSYLSISHSHAFGDSLISNIIIFFLGFTLWYPARFISPESHSVTKVLLNHIAAAFTVSFICAYSAYFILSHLFSDYYGVLDKTFSWRFIFGIFFYLFIVALVNVIVYYNNFREKELRESELNAQLKEAELKTLKYQLNPHFIFNSLNSISSLTLIAPDKAREMTIKLSDYMRNTLSRNDKKFVTLSDELKNIKTYLDIEMVRFENHFVFNENFQMECGNINVPNMILQPIFENIIKHAVYESTEQIEINLNCVVNEKYMIITVTNNYDPNAIPRKGKGIGLSNSNSRLKLLYNTDNLLTYSKNDSVFTVELKIPLNQ